MSAPTPIRKSKPSSRRPVFDIATELEECSHAVRDYSAFLDELLKPRDLVLGERTLRGMARVIHEITKHGDHLIALTNEVYEAHWESKR